MGIRGGMQVLDLDFEAGKEYTVSFDARVMSGYLMPMIGVESSNYDFEGHYDRVTSRDGDGMVG